MRINSTPSFKADFCHTESLKEVADYAVKKGKFDKLNEARKIIEKTDWFTKLKMNCGFNEANNQSFFEITSYKPVYTFEDGKVITTYKTKTTRRYYKEKNPIQLAYEKIIKMSNNNTRNKTYKAYVK